MRKQFDIKYRPQIESGEYMVETREGLPVRIICWDRLAKKHQDAGLNLCVLVPDDDGEVVYYYDRSGKRWLQNDDFDLFIVTPEPEMTVFEKKVYAYCDGKTVGEEIIKIIAKELLSIAREQFIKDGYVIEKKAFHDAVENISDKHLAEMSIEYSIHCKVKDGTRHAVMNWSEFQKLAQKFIDIGKEEALKDLPRWKPAAAAYDGDRLPRIDWSLKRLVARFDEGIFYLDMNDLYKLPGFKEDE